MASLSSESIWSSMIAVRQLSTTYYTLSTCLTDLLHRYIEISSSQSNKTSSSLFHNLDQTLFSFSNTPANQSKLLDEYTNILVNILKKNSIHTNIIQNVRRLFRFDSCLKELFTTELNEYCLCQECDCTISNSITDVIHGVSEIRTTLLTESSQAPSVCLRCGDQHQTKTITFKQFSPCLALTVHRLNINATDQLTTSQDITYALCYVIEFDSASRSIKNVYLRQDTQFIQVDGQDKSSRSETISGQGNFLTLWLSQSTPVSASSPPEVITPVVHNNTFLSPPQSAASSSQITTNVDTMTLNETPTTLDYVDVPMSSNTTMNNAEHDEDDTFWNSFMSETTPAENDTMSTTNNDTVSDLYITLLHTTNKDKTNITTRAEHDRTVNTLASDVLWPLIVNQTNRRSEKNTSSSSITTQSVSSGSSRTDSSSIKRNQSYKQLYSSTTKARRIHPYTKT